VLDVNSLLYADKSVCGTSDGADIKVKRPSVAGTTCKVDRLHFIEPYVNRRLVNEDKASLQWIQVASDGLV